MGRSASQSSAPDDAYDARGRARPIYNARTPRPPEAWRPNRTTRLMMGIVPGVSALVSGRVRTGAPYTILGLATLLGALLLAAGYPSTLETIRELRIQPRFIVFHAAAIWILVATYELLRFGASVETGPEHASRTPRLLATLWIPALLILIGGPRFVGHAPRVIEAAWFTSLVLVVGGAPAVAWCTFSDFLDDDPERRRLFWWWSAATVAVVVIVALGVRIGLGDSWAASATEAGFRLLPHLLD